MFKNILVPTDGSPLSQKAVKAAVKLAKTNRGKLTVVHVMPDYAAYVRERYNVPGILAAPLKQKFEKDAATVAKQHLDRACKLAKAAGVRCSGVAVASDTVHAAILKQASKAKCDTIMMASHGRRGLQGVLLGSETQKVLTHSKLPVVVCR